MDKVITRFPPSPTGHLHIGGARTALFNWLLARSNKGTFILRMEDTDVARSSRTMTDSILQALKWMGLDWDEGPYFQSQRFDLYHRHIEFLLDNGLAYYCKCSEQDVQAMRDEAWTKGEKPKYSGRCRDLGLKASEGRVVRFKSPLEGQTVFYDLLKGKSSVDNKELDDFVLRRADNAPTYNLAVVVDDAGMGITYILRGDDHFSNTPKQILLYQALGYQPPAFCHVPMILGPDKKRLSKRHGALSILKYREMGYLPEALLNYLVRLGWSHGDEEIFDRQEMIEKFSLKSLGKSASVFNPDKLLWVNSQHIKRAEPSYLAGLLNYYLQEKGLTGEDTDYLSRIIPLLQPRAGTMLEMADMAEFFVIPDGQLKYDSDLVTKYITPEVKPHLEALLHKLSGLNQFSQKALEDCISNYLEEQDIKFKLIAQPLRIAITARKASPGLFETMEALGKSRVINRLARVLDIKEDQEE